MVARLMPAVATTSGLDSHGRLRVRRDCRDTCAPNLNHAAYESRSGQGSARSMVQNAANEPATVLRKRS